MITPVAVPLIAHAPVPPFVYASDVPDGGAPAQAIDVLNNAFDECRTIVRYIAYVSGRPAPEASVTEGPSLKVVAYPNPYENDNFNLTINAPVGGQARIDLYTIDGLKVTEIKRNIVANKDEVVRINVPGLYKTRLVYVVTVGDYHARGIVLSPN